MAGGIQESPRPLHPSPVPSGEVPTPPQNEHPGPDNVDLSVYIPPSSLRADLTTQHLQRLFEWENAAWADARPFEVTTGQIHQELGEASDVWLKIADGKANLGDKHTIHHLTEEIGDGIIADAGLIRSLLERDDQRVIEEIHRALNQPDRTRGGVDWAVSTYLVKGYRMLETVEQGTSPQTMGRARKNELIQKAGGFMKAGFVALERLGADPGHVINSKIATNRLKYSPGRLEDAGSMEEAKRTWQERQLPVVGSAVVLDLRKAA
jgi:hypothetical protein